VRCSALQRVAVCCSMLQCVAVCCSVLQCVAVCSSVLQCAVQCVSVCYGPCPCRRMFVGYSRLNLVLRCVAVRCSVLNYAAVCCSVCCSVLQCVLQCVLQFVLQCVALRCRPCHCRRIFSADIVVPTCHMWRTFHRLLKSRFARKPRRYQRRNSRRRCEKFLGVISPLNLL